MGTDTAVRFVKHANPRSTSPVLLTDSTGRKRRTTTADRSHPTVEMTALSEMPHRVREGTQLQPLLALTLAAAVGHLISLRMYGIDVRR